MVAVWFTLAVWPPHGPLSTPQPADAIAWKIGVVVAAWVLLAVVASRTDLDDRDEPGPGRVIDNRYRRERRP